jgi:hypothetical protein
VTRNRIWNVLKLPVIHIVSHIFYAFFSWNSMKNECMFHLNNHSNDFENIYHRESKVQWMLPEEFLFGHYQSNVISMLHQTQLVNYLKVSWFKLRVSQYHVGGDNYYVQMSTDWPNELHKGHFDVCGCIYLRSQRKWAWISGGNVEITWYVARLLFFTGILVQRHFLSGKLHLQIVSYLDYKVLHSFLFIHVSYQ